jgi:hypothetical protein
MYPSYEEKNEIVKRWVHETQLQSSEKRRYTLRTVICVIDNDYEKTTGTVTDHACLELRSNDLQFLRDFWHKNHTARNFETTTWHYIYDNQEDQLVETLSICC